MWEAEYRWTTHSWVLRSGDFVVTKFDSLEECFEFVKQEEMKNEARSAYSTDYADVRGSAKGGLRRRHADLQRQGRKAFEEKQKI